MEQLIYDCRLLNVALREGRESALKLRDWLAESDSPLDPQAYILRPDVVLKICERLACAETPLEMTFFAVEETLAILRDALERKKLTIPEREILWLDLLSAQLEILPREEDALWRQVKSALGDIKINPEEYLLC
jgi:methanol--5-hydroxybenzimidazolylcobamide Co-methyltransferase